MLQSMGPQRVRHNLVTEQQCVYNWITLYLKHCKSNLQWDITSHQSDWASSKKSTNNKCWRRCGEKGTLLYYWWECKLVQSLWGLTWRFLKELNSELPYDPAIPFLGISQFSSVAQSCLTLYDPMNCSTPGLHLPIHHQLPEFTQTHVHRVSDAIQPSHPLSSPSPPAPNPSQHLSLFQSVNSSHKVAKVLEFQL